MSNALFIRLLWKEYRVQRSIWIALFLATIALQILIYWLNYERTTNLWVGLVMIGGGIGWFYALAAGAVGFAVEREDDTHIRLVSLVCPAGMTIWVKVLFGSIASWLFFGLSIAFATVLIGSSGNSFDFREVERDWGAICSLILISHWFAMTGAMFWSLLVSRALIALVFSGATCVIIQFFTFSVVMDAYRTPHLEPQAALVYVTSLIVVSICLLICSWLSARRWLNRDFVSGPAMTSRRWFPRVRFVQVQSDGSIVVPVDNFDDDRFEVLSPKEAVLQPPPFRIRWWSLWLYRGRRQRVWKFLLWRELAETRFWFTLTLPVFFVIGVMNLRHSPMASTMGFGLLAMLMCGFMTFRQEQKRDQFLFLIHRGVAPSTVWWTKQIAWSWRAGLCLLALFTPPFLRHPESFLQSFFTCFSGDIFLVSPQEPNWIPPGPLMALASLFGTVSVLVTYFAIGQAASLIVRRPIVALFAALFTSSLLTSWLAMMNSLRVTPLATTVPMSIGLILATWLYCRPWMMQRLNLMVRARVLAAIAIGPLGCIGLTMWARISEVPFDWRSTDRAPLFGSWVDLNADPRPYFDQRAELLKSPSNAELQTAQDYRQAFASLRANRDVQWNSNDPAQIEETLPKIKTTIDQVIEWSQRSECCFVDAMRRNPRDVEQWTKDIQDVIGIMTQEARDDLRVEKNLTRAAATVIAAMNLCHQAQSRASLSLPVSTTVGQILPLYLEIAAHPKADLKLVDQLVSSLTNYRNLMPTPEAYLAVNTQYRLHLLSRDPSEWLPGSSGASYDDDGAIWQSLFLKLPGETERLRRLILWSDHIDATINHEFVSDSKTYTQFFITRDHHQRVVVEHQRDQLLRTTLLAKLLPPNDFNSHEFLEADALLKGTLIGLVVIAEHRGQPVPRDLTFKRKLGFGLADPFDKKQQLDWWPDGLPEETTQSTSNISTDFKSLKGRPFILAGELRPALAEILIQHFVQGPTAPEGGVANVPSAMPQPGMPGDGVTVKLNPTGKFSWKVTGDVNFKLGDPFIGKQIIIALPKDCFAPLPSDVPPAWKSRINKSFPEVQWEERPENNES